MIHLEESAAADAQQSVLNTTLDDVVEGNRYGVINQDDEKRASIQSARFSAAQ